MPTSRLLALVLVAGAVSVAACSSTPSGNGFDGRDAGNGGPGKEGSGGPVGTPENPGSFGTPSDASTSTGGGCAPSPGNFDIPGNNCDDDGDGKIDNVATCDTGLSMAGDADAFARAIGLCQKATGKDDTKWGVVSARYTKGYTTTEPPAFGQHGILPKFGNVVRPREGAVLGVLSSGWAREYDSETGRDIFKGEKPSIQGGALPFPVPGQPSGAPPGFPKAAAGCGTPINVTYDLINVKLEIKVPANAQGLQFDFDFLSGEWPEYVCGGVNDSFIAYLKSSAFNSGRPDNISFDAQKNPVGVDNGFFDRCTPNTITGCIDDENSTKRAACPGGEAELAGTGFEARGTYCGGKPSVGGGATGWLTSQAPVKSGEVITLELMIWDTGDWQYDSSVLIDNFRWVPGPVTTETVRPPPR